MKNSLFILISTFLVVSCITPEDPPYPLPDNAVEILAGDNSKTWKLAKRMSNETEIALDDCSASYRQTFNTDHTMRDNRGSLENCGETLSAEWKFSRDERDYYYIQLSSEQIPRLMGIKENEKLFKIRFISENELVVEHPDNQFSSRLATIVDIYVPEGSSASNLKYEEMLMSSLED